MSRSWTDIDFSFSLPAEDRERLDDLMRARGTSLGLQFKRTLIECLRQAGVDPGHLDHVPVPQIGQLPWTTTPGEKT